MILHQKINKQNNTESNYEIDNKIELAESNQTSIDDLLLLSNDNNDLILEKIINNKNCTKHILENIFNKLNHSSLGDNSFLLEMIVRHEKFSSISLMEDLYYNIYNLNSTKHYFMKISLLYNINCPIHIFKNIFKDFLDLKFIYLIGRIFCKIKDLNYIDKNINKIINQYLILR